VFLAPTPSALGRLRLPDSSAGFFPRVARLPAIPPPPLERGRPSSPGQRGPQPTSSTRHFYDKQRRPARAVCRQAPFGPSMAQGCVDSEEGRIVLTRTELIRLNRPACCARPTLGETIRERPMSFPPAARPAIRCPGSPVHSHSVQFLWPGGPTRANPLGLLHYGQGEDIFRSGDAGGMGSYL